MKSQIMASILVLGMAFAAMGSGAAPGFAQSADGAAAAEPAAPVLSGEAAAKSAVKPAVRDPGKGPVTNLPLPRYVSLKTNQGNARRGPGLSHRIDWVFTTEGMPLRVTAEYEHWRRVEDVDGAGGWVHYSLLSGARSVLVTQDMAQFRVSPDALAAVVYQAEYGVIGRLLECAPDWCRISVDGEKGWTEKVALWGVEPGEVVE